MAAPRHEKCRIETRKRAFGYCFTVGFISWELAYRVFLKNAGRDSVRSPFKFGISIRISAMSISHTRIHEDPLHGIALIATHAGHTYFKRFQSDLQFVSDILFFNTEAQRQPSCIAAASARGCPALAAGSLNAQPDPGAVSLLAYARATHRDGSDLCIGVSGPNASSNVRNDQ